MSNKTFIPNIEDANVADLIYFSRTAKIYNALSKGQRNRLHILINERSGHVTQS
jgi:hypothetical protein